MVTMTRNGWGWSQGHSLHLGLPCECRDQALGHLPRGAPRVARVELSALFLREGRLRGWGHFVRLQGQMRSQDQPRNSTSGNLLLRMLHSLLLLHIGHQRENKRKLRLLFQDSFWEITFSFSDTELDVMSSERLSAELIPQAALCTPTYRKDAPSPWEFLTTSLSHPRLMPGFPITHSTLWFITWSPLYFHLSLPEWNVVIWLLLSCLFPE